MRLRKNKMLDIVKIIILIVQIRTCICDSNLNSRSENMYVPLTSYRGESFPKKFLVPEDYIPTESDLEYYTKSLQRVVNYFYTDIKNTNRTDLNSGVGIYFMNAILKKTLHERRPQLKNLHYDVLKNLIRKNEDYLTRYINLIRLSFDENDTILRIIKLLRDDTVQVYSMGNFNKGRLSKWILSNIPMHSYIQKMDNLTFAKDHYAHVTQAMDSFFVSVTESDECLSRIVYNPEPIVLSEVRQCRPDRYCREVLLSSPSAAYALSHRLLNLMMLRHSRRCYVQTEKEDDDLMDTLCAFMYREVVYVARLGFFARDLFLEHVALCGLLGYEEFLRHQWFRKAASWVDDEGCIHETRNFLINRTRVHITSSTDVKKQNEFRKKLKLQLIEQCDTHAMTLLTAVLGHAIRHSLHFITK